MSPTTAWTVPLWNTTFTQQAALFRVAVADADEASLVPTTPGWTFRDLTLRVGRFAHQVRLYLTISSREMLEPVPVPDGDPVAYLDEHLAGLADALAETPPARPMWTFSPAAPDLAWVWHRRAAHELNLRRWEAQAALRTLQPTERDLAVDGIDEALGTLLPAKYGWEVPVPARGTALVEVNDGPQAWYVTFHPGEVPTYRWAQPGEEADARLRTSTTNMLYHLRGRTALTGAGDESILRALVVD